MRIEIQLIRVSMALWGELTGVIVTSENLSASLCLSPSMCFWFLCCLTFSWYPCPLLLQPVHFDDESAQHRLLLEEGRDVMWHQQESLPADGHSIAGYTCSSDSVHLARPSPKCLVSVSICRWDSDPSSRTLAHFWWTGTKCCWLFTPPLTACEGVFRAASPDTHLGSQDKYWTKKEPSCVLSHTKHTV